MAHDQHQRPDSARADTLPGFADLDRRAFLATAGRFGFWGLVAAAAGGPLGALTGTLPDARAAGFGEPTPGSSRTPTPGFASAAETAEQRTVAAILETVLPGPTTDQDIGPGALEAGALSLVYDTFYPVRPYLAPMVTLIDAQARQRHGAAFTELGREDREALLFAVQELLPFLRHAWRFVRAAFFADLHDATGSTWLGFPGPNLGYVDHPEFSFRRPLCEEMTDDGNHP